MSWPVGTIVVCVSLSPDQQGAPPSPDPVVGDYYTVTDRDVCSDGSSLIGLAELPLPADWMWDAVDFRLAESSHSEAGSVRKSEHAK